MRLLSLALMIFIGFSSLAQPTKDSADLNSYFKPVKWRCIGPFRGGRSVTATGVVGEPYIYYMGTTGGGVWKTEDMGITWSNISDGFFKTGSVGAVAVSESNHNILYVGMGEHAVRNVMTSYGDGVYKSLDAGKTWKKTGLDLTQHIARIVIDPKDPNTILVAAQGALYGKSKERGIYRSTDGGATWKNVLFVNEKTGCTDLSMDMNQPNVLYASMWEHGRVPWQVTSGGPGSGLYKSVDGGEHWERMENGLPKAMGKMSIAVCRSNSAKVYALIESDFTNEEQGLYVSEDAGKSWSHVSSDHRLTQRAWYYIKIFPDPLNENTLYTMSAQSLKSVDGGKTWEDVSSTHGDYHHLWINPANSNNMIVADDGGAAITFNGGKSWSSQNNQPTAQFYRINVDNLFPYNIYGGQQDNSTVKIASREIGGGGISVRSWTSSAGGESAFLAFNPDDPRYVMGGSYAGTVDILDSKANASTNVMEAPILYQAMDGKDMKYRFTWNAPIIWSKHEPGVFYHGAQYLLRTDDMGKTWKEVSPDLSRNEKDKQGKAGVPYTNEAVGGENYGTLAYIAESPFEKGVIYTGSDDGLVHLTKDNGAHWQNITPPGLPECLINAIEISPFDKATAYIATTRYKFNDYAPAIYKTTDYGKTWTKIANGIPYGAHTRVVREDNVRKDLLFAGTELGIYISWNGGKDWSPFQLNLPIVPVTDLRIHQGNLIAATAGRSYWILDDLNQLRQYKKDNGSLNIFKPSPAVMMNGYSELDQSKDDFTGVGTFNGVNPSTGVVIYYELPEIKDSTLHIRLEIKDEAGNIVRTYTSKEEKKPAKYNGVPAQQPVLPKKKGLNRFVWDMRYPSLPGVPEIYMAISYKGHKASPGKYTVTLYMGDKTVSTDAAILPNPLYRTTAEGYKEYHTVMLDMETKAIKMLEMVNVVNTKRQQLENIIAALPEGTAHTTVKAEALALSKKMKAWDDDMVQRKCQAYDDEENFPNKFTMTYIFLINQTESEIPQVNQPSLDLKQQLDAQWTSLKGRGEEILENDIPALNKKFWEAGVGAIWKN